MTLAPGTRRTREVRVGDLTLGGGNPVRVQSMTNTRTADVAATLAQIASLEETGCEIVRVAVSSRNEVRAFGAIRQETGLPLVADIQHNHRFALECLALGADKVRVNPGNIGSRDNYVAVLEAAGNAGKAIRVGINSGSVEEDLLARHGGPTPAAMLDSLRRALATADQVGFRDLVVSMKSSGVMPAVEAYRLASRETDCPLHLGVTEAGGPLRGSVKSAVGLGILLNEGIGDTIRVSLTGPPETEVSVGWDILRALGLRRRGVEVVSCPTCSRTGMDMVSLVERVEEHLRGIAEPLTVAVMGCPVNGPGEAREADVGLAGGAGTGAIFRKGRIVRRVTESDCLEALLDEVRALLAERAASESGERE